jgi:bacillithiol system protein YtxJ
MNWNKLEQIDQINQIKIESNNEPILIFKHSTRCSISSTSLDRFERSWTKTQVDKPLKLYFLDLIKNREVSNAVARDLGIEHESPQILLLKNGEVIYHESHYGIALDEVLERI